MLTMTVVLLLVPFLTQQLLFFFLLVVRQAGLLVWLFVEPSNNIPFQSLSLQSMLFLERNTMSSPGLASKNAVFASTSDASASFLPLSTAFSTLVGGSVELTFFFAKLKFPASSTCTTRARKPPPMPEKMVWTPHSKDADHASAVFVVVEARGQRPSSPYAFSRICVKESPLVPFGAFCKGFIISYFSSKYF